MCQKWQVRGFRFEPFTELDPNDLPHRGAPFDALRRARRAGRGLGLDGDPRRRSPAFTGTSVGATTAQSTPSSTSCQWSTESKADVTAEASGEAATEAVAEARGEVLP